MTVPPIDSSKIARPSPLACIECRKKHLKCDAAAPECSRCVHKGLTCSYTPSQRGRGGRTRRMLSPRLAKPDHVLPTPAYEPTEYGHYNLATHQLAGSHDASHVAAGHSTLAPSAHPLSPAPTWSDSTGSKGSPTNNAPSRQVDTPASTSSRSSLRSEHDHLINQYYSRFHKAHPFLVSRRWYSDRSYPSYLISAIELIGSRYASGIQSGPLQIALSDALRTTTDKCPELVQSLLLYTVYLHSIYEPAEAMVSMTRAADIAIELGMHQADFANKHGQSDAVYEESLRRTWWELYIIDGYLAALHRNTNFRCNGVASHPYLPCEEVDYAEGHRPTTLSTLDNFDDRLFAEDEQWFSSYCYRIDAIRILARVIAVSTANGANADEIQAIDNAIAGWQLHLPNERAHIIDHAGEVDHMMFQAFMFIHCASIFLHFPRSELPITMPPAAEIACAQRHMEQVSPTSTQHAVKALSASKELANIATLPNQDQSPLFICGLVFACIAQLSACCAYPRSDTRQNRDRISLIIGALKVLSRTWSIASHVGTQLKRAASEIFKPRASQSASTEHDASPLPTVTDFAAFPADLSWLDIFYADGPQSQMLAETELTRL